MYLLFIIKEVNVINGARSLTSGEGPNNIISRYRMRFIYDIYIYDTIYIYILLENQNHGLVYLLALTSLCSLPSPPPPPPHNWSVFGVCSLAGIIRIWIMRHHLILGKCWVLFILLYVCYSSSPCMTGDLLITGWRRYRCRPGSLESFPGPLKVIRTNRSQEARSVQPVTVSIPTDRQWPTSDIIVSYSMQSPRQAFPPCRIVNMCSYRTVYKRSF